MNYLLFKHRQVGNWLGQANSEGQAGNKFLLNTEQTSRFTCVLTVRVVVHFICLFPHFFFSFFKV